MPRTRKQTNNEFIRFIDLFTYKLLSSDRLPVLAKMYFKTKFFFYISSFSFRRHHSDQQYNEVLFLATGSKK